MGITDMIYLFSDQPYEGVEHLPLFEIRYTSTPMDISSYDTLIFTSKNALKALEALHLPWQTKACYAIGEATAQCATRLGGNVLFTCKDSYGDAFARELIPLLGGKRVLFPRAKEVSSSLFEILKRAGIEIDEQIVYETVCRTYSPSDAPPKGSKLIFTSPSTVHCFFKNFAWDESYRAIAIGTKTADALPPHVKKRVAAKPSIASCVALAKAI
jgi:uroporphyrinogen-III synthase